MGFAAYYIPISNVEDRDILFGEDPLKKFKSAYPVEMYLSTALQYEGERDFFSKFGLQIKNEVQVIVSKRTNCCPFPVTPIVLSEISTEDVLVYP